MTAIHKSNLISVREVFLLSFPYNTWFFVGQDFWYEEWISLSWAYSCTIFDGELSSCNHQWCR